MDVSITQVPVWLSLVFILCFSTIPLFLIHAVKASYKAGKVKGSASITKKIALFYACYFIAIALVSATGFFSKNTVPPRILFASTIPLFLFYMLYVQKTKWFQVVWKHIKLEQLIFIHIFRFVGVFFFLVYYYGAIPKEFAYVGGFGDIITAFLVIPLVIALKKELPFAKLFAWIWNIIGLVDIICVLATAVILTKTAIATDQMGVEQFGTFPFSWIPAFAPATIVFLHILIFKKLKEKTTSNVS